MNRRLILEVGLLSLASLLQGAGFSLIAPFYPKEAFDRGNTATHVGIVMGTYQLVMFLSSPYFGWALSQRFFNPRILLWLGLIVDGLSSAVFGSVIYITDSSMFFLVSLALRIIQSLGNAASMTCYFTILGAEFPTVVGSLIPIIETAFNAGLIIGPFLGGITNDYMGFSLTFVMFGGCLASIGVICGFLFPTPQQSNKKNLSLRKTLREKRICFNIMLFIVALMCVGFNDATLAVHLKNFGLSSTTKGLMFVPCGLAQSICSPLWGKLASEIPRPRVLCAIGAIFCACCFFLCGPSPLLPFGSTMELTVIAQLCLGVGIGAVYIPAFIDTIQYCLNHLRYPDEVPTYALLSGILTASLCFGSAVGASGGGALLDLFGYPWASQLMVVILCGSCFVISVSMGGSPSSKEASPLVDEQPV